MEEFTRIDGKKKGKVILYALSTCVWCRKTKKLLDDLGVEYYFVYMDDLSSELESKYKEEVKKWNPKASYPTIIIDDSKCIVGFDEDCIRKELE